MSPLMVRGTLNKADLLPIARYAAWNRTWVLKVFLGIGCVQLLAGIAGVVVGLAGNAVVSLLLGSLFTAYSFFAPSLSIKNQMKVAGHLSEEATYEFDEAQFRIARPSQQISMPWNSIHSAVEMKDQFAIFTTKACFLSVPKRFFPADQVSTFRNLLVQVLGTAGKQIIPYRVGK